MAHECPECYEMCYCGGDIDDCLLNCERDVVACTHCVCKKCGEMKQDCDCYRDEREYDDEHEPE